ncbi:SulP family inorganic anion transporter [Amycolatopsis sp. FDAARGOS 1241]|uniref:SulP family inorganic anion transporter n=1 Tax=Amycolatopsis sp. FDAARGOS 1241 TaxID=2778070 RepID=UPI00351C45D4
MTAVLALFVAGDPACYAMLAAPLAVLCRWPRPRGGECCSPSRCRAWSSPAARRDRRAHGRGSARQRHRSPVRGDGFAGELESFVSHLGLVHWPAVAWSCRSCCNGSRRGCRDRWGDGGGHRVVAAAGLQGIGVVGAVPAGLPPALPGVPVEVGQLVPPALGIAIVALSDNVLTARVRARGRRRDRRGPGTACGRPLTVSSGLLQGFAVSSSGSRNALGSAAGRRTRLYSSFALGTAVVIVLFARPLLAEFPKAALGALVVFAAT